MVSYKRETVKPVGCAKQTGQPAGACACAPGALKERRPRSHVSVSQQQQVLSFTGWGARAASVLPHAVGLSELETGFPRSWRDMRSFNNQCLCGLPGLASD